MLSAFILTSIPFVALLYTAVTYFTGGACIHLLLNLYQLEVLSAFVSVLLNYFIIFKFLFNFLFTLNFALRNLVFCAKSIISSSIVIRSFTCCGHLILFIPYFKESSFCEPSSLLFLLLLV